MMLPHLVTACLIYISLVLQSCVSCDMTFHSCRPWFPGIVLAACLLIHDEIAGVVWAGILGLVVDGLGADRMGVHLVVTTVVAAGLLLARQDTRSNGTLLLGPFVFVGTLIWRLASATTQGILDRRDFNLQESLSVAFGDGVYTAVTTVAIGLLIRLFWQASDRHKTSNPIALKNRWSMLAR